MLNKQELPIIMQTTEKVFKTNPTLWCNKMCKLNCLMPKYIHSNPYPANVENMVS